MPNINEMLINDADENNALNMLRGVIAQQRAIAPIVSTSFDSGNLPNEFISPSTPDGSVEPTGADFIGTFMSGQGREFPIRSVNQIINIGGVNLGVLQFGGSQEDGAFYAGGGVVKLDANGIDILAETENFNELNAYTFTDAQGETIGGMYGSGAGYPSVDPTHIIFVSSEPVAGEDSEAILQAYAPDGNDATSKISARTTSDENYIKIETGATDKITLDVLTATGMEIIGGASQKVNIYLGGDDQMIFDNNNTKITIDNYLLEALAGVVILAETDGYDAGNALTFRDANAETIGGLYGKGLTTYQGSEAAHYVKLESAAVTGESSVLELPATTPFDAAQVRIQSRYFSLSNSSTSTVYYFAGTDESANVELRSTILHDSPLVREDYFAVQANYDTQFYISSLDQAVCVPLWNFGVKNIAPVYDVDVDGDVNVTGNYYINGVPISSGLTFDYIQFNTAITGPTAEGQIAWDTDEGTLSIGMPGGNVHQQVGMEMYVPRRVKRGTAGNVLNGQLVYVSGGTGANLTVELALANAEQTSLTTIAMATEDFSNTNSGWCTTFGLVRGDATQPINTNSYAPGTKLYLSATSAGGFTDTPPTTPNHTVLIGTVFRQHTTDGAILVNIEYISHVRNVPSTAAQNTIQPSADVVALTIKQPSGGTSNIAEWQTSGGSNVAAMSVPSGTKPLLHLRNGTASMTASANSILFVDAGATLYNSEYTGSGAFTGFLLSNSNANGVPFVQFYRSNSNIFWSLTHDTDDMFSIRQGLANGTKRIQINDAGGISFLPVSNYLQTIIKGHSTQTFNLTEWQDSSSTVLASINAAGSLKAQGVTLAYVAKTANYTVGADDYTVEATSGTFTLTLPTAVGVTGKIYQIKSTSTGIITLATTSSQLIDGALTQTLSQYENLTVQSNGANWILIH